MDRVVTAIDYGDFEEVVGGVRDRVFFIIFELAQGDLRSHVKGRDPSTLTWLLATLKPLFVGIQQLHKGGVCHNDFKPANALVFDELLHKVADLGRATSGTIPAPHSGLCVGDFRYAAPEQMYHSDRVTDHLSDFDRRRCGDLYSLGSLIHYLISKRMMTPEIVSAMPIQYRPNFIYGGWGDSYSTVLPFWRLEFDAKCLQMRSDLSTPASVEALSTRLCEMVVELCEPDPRLRGHPMGKRPGQDAYALDRYISEIDLLFTRAKIILK